MSLRKRGWHVVAATAVVVAATHGTFAVGMSETEADKIPDAASGGELTVPISSSEAFATPAPNLTGERLERHLKGDAEFEARFVTEPAPVNPGLGPHFNNASCIACHTRDGRGRPDKIGEALSSLFLRVSMPGRRTDGGPPPVPGLGNQLADRAVYGERAEGRMEVDYTEFEVELSDGERVSLRRPHYRIVDAKVPLPDEILMGPRVAPPVFGRGLLEAIPEEAILALADPEDADGDGISGRPNRVWNPVTERKELGRFGLKANNPTLLVQSASAYLDDMGVTPPALAGYSGDRNEEGAEVSWETLEDVTFYVQTLAVPARRNPDDPMTARGEELFGQLNCAACHHPEFTTATLEGLPEVSNQKIRPYTDLLLHDMGPGLADGRPDFEADGSEWRTPPLWGIGLTRVVSGHTFFLHDGRARTLEEAILWHGGEAAHSREQYKALSKTDRHAVLRFLESL